MILAAALALAGTVVSYLLAERIDARVRSPLTNPVGLTVAVWVVVIATTKLDLSHYDAGTEPLVAALRPAVVALGWVMYRQRHALRRHLAPLLVGTTVGTVTSLTAAPLLAQAFGADTILRSALALKSVTSAVGVDMAGRVGADAALTVPLIIATGIFGAAFGPALLRRFGRFDDDTIGVAVGTNSHGIGTAAIAREGRELATALSGLAMGLAAVLTGLFAPLVFALLHLG